MYMRVHGNVGFNVVPRPAGQASWKGGDSTAPGGQKRALWRHVHACTSAGRVGPAGAGARCTRVYTMILATILAHIGDQRGL
jgi:hypothetical protein